MIRMDFIRRVFIFISVFILSHTCAFIKDDKDASSQRRYLSEKTPSSPLQKMVEKSVSVGDLSKNSQFLDILTSNNNINTSLLKSDNDLGKANKNNIVVSENGRNFEIKKTNDFQKSKRLLRLRLQRSKKKTENVNSSSLSCAHVNGYYNHRFLKMITQCPVDWFNQTTRHNCQLWDRLRSFQDVNKITMLPVQDRNGTVYANVFCAICHDVQTVFPWSTSLNCSISSFVFNFQNSNKNTTSSDSVTLNIADISTLSTLSETTKCRVKVVPAFPDAIQRCQHDNRYMNMPFVFLRLSKDRGIYKVETPSPTISFSLLLNFDFNGDTHILLSASQQILKTEYIKLGRCDESQIYDKFYGRCRPVKCNEPFYRLRGSSCVLDDQYSSENSISEAHYFDKVAEISLSVNITLSSYLMMRSIDNLNEIVSQQLGSHLNISENRIQDMNIKFDFETTNEIVAEVHQLDQPSPEEKQNLHSKVGDMHDVSENGYQYKNKQISENRKSVIEPDGNKRERNHNAENEEELSRNDSQTQKEIRINHNSNTSTAYHDPVHGKHNIMKKRPDGRYVSTSNRVKNEFREISNPKTANFNNYPITGFSNISRSTKRYNFGYTSSITSQITTKPTPEEWVTFPNFTNLINTPMTMHISFLLFPAQKQKPSDERTPTLVRKITHLIRTKSLNIDVKGNQLNVSGVHNNMSSDRADTEFCPWGRWLSLSNDKFKLEEINGTNYLYSIEDTKYYKQGLFNLYALAQGKNNAEDTSLTYFEKFSFVCAMPRITHDDCRRIDLTADEYHKDTESKSIIFEGKEYNMSMYTVLNVTSGLIQICVPQSYDDFHTHFLSPQIIEINNCGPQYKNIRNAESYLTMILGRISTIALALVFITYCLFPGLRTLPGCNIMNLTLALLIAELVFIENIFVQDDNICAAVATILHFFFLAAHFWMNVISFDVHRTFSKKNRLILTREDSVGKRIAYFPRYFAYAWGAPLIIVGICIIIEYTDFSEVQIGYKKQGQTLDFPSPIQVNYSVHNHNTRANEKQNETKILQNVSKVEDFSDLQHRKACWIQNPVAALSAFGAPVLMIFLTNCTFFIRTILSVSRTVKMTRVNLNRQDSGCITGKISGRAETMLYLRMSTVMGFTWVFGLSSAIISSVATSINTTICILVYANSILFTIFNISQGIFIFVAFLCNRRVLKLYGRLFLRLKQYLLRKSHKSIIYSISSPKSLHNVN